MTTHDLSLAEIADGLAPAARNVHFDDHVVGGDLRFDYRLKPGPVTRSNALAIMRAVGLDVPETDGAPAAGASEAVTVRRVRDGAREVDVLDDGAPHVDG